MKFILSTITAVAALLVALAHAQAGPPQGSATKNSVPLRQPADAAVRDAGEEIAYSVRIKLIESERSGSDEPFIRPGARIALEKLARTSPPAAPGERLPPPAQAERGGEGATPVPEPVPEPAPIAPAATRSRRPMEDATWDTPLEPGTHVLAAPRLEVLANVPATIETNTHQSFSFLEPLGDNRFVAKNSAFHVLGMKISVVVKPGDRDRASVAVCELRFQTTAMVGREPVEGLDLEVGKPIISSWSLETTATVKLGTTVSIVLPSGPGQEAILLVNISRSNRDDEGPVSPPAAPQR